MPRPIRAAIDVAAFRHNYLRAKAAAPGARAWAVIKANAYGHGLLRCARAVETVADGYAMLDFAEAATLREAGIRQPILMLEGAFDPADVRLAGTLGLGLTVHDAEQIRLLELEVLAQPLDVFLKLNTGMNRLGFAPERAGELAARLKSISNVASVTLMTHFARADDEVGIADQLARFDAAASGLGLPQSVANSAALLRFPQAARDWVRPGIMLYGGSPMPGLASADALGLQPAMNLESRLIAVQTLAPGEAIGYGGRFVAERPTRVGIVACGYADGYPRHAPSGTPILVAGQRTGTLGRVSMDMLACDLSALPDAGVGSQVVLWGRGLPADEVATAADTISYELFCALANRVPVTVVGAD
ncbi:catabolic alanine racemase DadX [Niveibacterium umoris]|uniref:Alanine racemase n=1 Tax=Niveibacterium umoris TaxID=1193620 RepID=A0A840BIJ4_9RHOO|nr:alanine racemase [Niveibacterium umoris]MBB4010746.1 alanine racemase [Niveibacterium umoris]